MNVAVFSSMCLDDVEDAMAASGLVRNANWKPETTASGLRMVWSGPLDSIDPDRMELMAGSWLPDMLPIERIESVGESIKLTSAVVSAGGRAGSPHAFLRHAADRLSRLCRHLIEIEDLTPVLSPCGVRVLPVPRSFCRVLSDVRERRTRVRTPGIGLRFSGREDCLERCFRLVESTSSMARAVVFHGGEGSGKSTLLRVASARAALRGFRVEYGLEGLDEVDERPVVIVLDDLDLRDEALARVAAMAERSRRRQVLVIATTSGRGSSYDLPGLSVDVLRLPRLSASTLVQASISIIDGERLRAAAVCARGNPLRYRLIASSAVELESSSPSRAIDSKLESLSVAASELLAAVALYPEGVDSRTLSALVNDARPSSDAWFEVGGLISCDDGRLRIASSAVRDRIAFADPELTQRLMERAVEGVAAESVDRLARARLLSRLGRQEEARVAAMAAMDGTPSSALRALRSLRDDGFEADTALNLREVSLLAQTGRYASAVEAREAREVESSGVSDRVRLQVHRARHLERCGDVAGAEMELAASGAYESSDPGLGIERLLALGWVALRKGEPATAEQQFKVALEQSTSLDPRYNAEALAGLGSTLSRGGSARGPRLLRQAQRLFAELGLHGRRAEVLSAEGGAALRRGDEHVALERKLLALEASLRGGDPLDVARCRCDVATLLLERGELCRADTHVRQALAIFDRAGDVRSLTLARVLQGAVALERGQLTGIECVFEQALTIARRNGEPLAEHRALLLLARVEVVRGRLDAAWGRLEVALGVARTLDDQLAGAETRLLRAIVLLDAGDVKEGELEAEAGLRLLAPVESSGCALRLRLAMVRARLCAGDTDGAQKLLRSKKSALGAVCDPAIQVEAASLEASCEVALLASDPDQGRASAVRFDAVITLADGQERPDVLARVLVDLVRAPGRDGDGRRMAAARRLRELLAGEWYQERRQLLELTEVDVAADDAISLAADGLAQLEIVMRADTEDVDRRCRVIEFVRSRVPCVRAALLSDDGQGLRVQAQSVLPQERADSGPLGLALMVCERARLTAAPLVVGDVSGDSLVAQHDEVERWGLGSLLVVRSRSGLFLYLDRRDEQGPFTAEELRFAEAVVERAGLEALGAESMSDSPRSRMDVVEDDLGIIGASDAMSRLRQEIRSVARFDLPVFLRGESGTGKELVARAIHRLSDRAAKPWVPVNCAALAESVLEAELFGAVRGAFTDAKGDREGLLAQADGGILFLDEVAELSPSFQAKLLRVVELGEFRPVGSPTLRSVDVRFICATHRDIRREVQTGHFREDLYYRLMSTAVIELPPVRKRPGDVAVLMAHFVQSEARRHGVAPLTMSRNALAALESYAFPGNVRQLERLLAGLYARCRTGHVELEDLPVEIVGVSARERVDLAVGLRQALEDCELTFLKNVLRAHGNNRTHAARAAGIARQTLVTKLKKFGLDDVVTEADEPGGRSRRSSKSIRSR